MLKTIRLAVALVTLCAMAATAASASALEMTINPGGRVTATSSSVTFEDSGISVTCPLTLTLSLLSGPIQVAAGSQIGEVTEGRINNERCSSGVISGFLNMPWRVTINSTLPAIERLTSRTAERLLIDIDVFSWNWEFYPGGFINCLYSGTAGALIPLTHLEREGTRYVTGSFELLSAVAIPRQSGGFGCEPREYLSGRFSLSARQTITLS